MGIASAHRRGLEKQNSRLASALALAVVAASFGVSVSAQADTYANNGGTALNSSGSWVDLTNPSNVAVPGATDIAAWDSNDTNASATTYTLGGDTSWQGILFQNPTAAVTIGAGASNLTLGSSGINMSNASQNLTIAALNLNLAANQTWSVGSSASLAVTAPVNLANFFATIDGAGAKSVSGVVSGTGGLIKLGTGNLTLSNAETYTGNTTLNNGNFILDFTQGTSPASNILPTTAVVNATGGHLILNGSSSSTSSQTLANLNIQTGASSIDVNPGASQSAGLSVTAALNRVNGTGVTSGGTIRFGTTGTITLGANLNSTVLVDAGGNPYATYGLGDWAATNGSGQVIAATYVTTYASGANFDVTSNQSQGSITPASVRFNSATPTTLTINSGATATLQGILVTPNSGGATIAGPGFIRAHRNSGQGVDLTFIQNSTIGDLTVGAPISNASSGYSTNVVKSGPGRLVLNNTGNSYSGYTYVNEGTVAVNNNGDLGAQATGAAVIFSGGTLEATGNVGLYNGVVGTNNRPLTLNAQGGSLLADTNTTMTIPGVVSGSGALNITGAGSINLSGVNTFTGGTNVANGTLLVTNASGSSATGSGAVTVGSGATLGGTGFLTGNTTILSGGHIDPGVGGLGTLTLGNLTLNSGSILDYELGAGGSDLTTLTGNLINNGAGINLYQTGTTSPFATNGTYNLFTVAGTIPANITLSVLDPVAGITYAFGTNGGNVTLTISGGKITTTWANTSGGSWGVAGNWSNGIPSNAGDTASFGSAITGPATVTLDGNQIAGTVVLNNSNSYTIAQGSGGSLILDNGSGSAFVTDVNGSHSITAPVVLNSSVAITTSNATDVLTFGGVISGNGNATVSGPGTVIFSNDMTYTGVTTIGSGTLQLGNGGTTGSVAGAIVDNGTLVFNRSDGTIASPRIIATTISGTGGVTFNGNSVRQLTGNNTFTGPINLNAGTLQLGSATALGGATNVLTQAAGTTFDVNGQSASLGGLSGSGVVDNTSATASTLTINQGAATTYSGTIQNTGTGGLALVKSGNGALTLAGNNTYSGGTTISGGSIVAASNQSLGTGNITVSVIGGLQVNDGVTIANNILVNSGANEFVGTSGTATLTGNITVIGSTQYRLGSSGTLIATGTHTVGYVNGATNVSLISFITRGNVVFQGNGSLTNLFQGVTIGRSTSSTATANLTVQDNAFIAGTGITIGGDGGTNSDASTTVTLNGSGLLNAETGNINLNNGQANTVTTINVNGNGTLQGAGFVEGSNASLGQTTVNFNGGHIVATAGDTATPFFASQAHPTAVNILVGGLTVDDGGHAITIAQPLLNGTGGADGGLVKNGNGTLALNGVNTYTGDTVVNSGTLAGTGTIAGRVVGGSGAHSIAPGTTTAGSIGTLTVGGLATNGNTTLSFDLGAPGGTNDLIAITGNASLNGGIIAVASNAATGASSLGYYKVLTYSGTLSGTGMTLAATSSDPHVVYSLDMSKAGEIDVHKGFLGDANDSGTVDATDLNLVLSNFGKVTKLWGDGNFDGAATVDLTDLAYVLNNFGQTVSTTAVSMTIATPEPTSLALLVPAAAALLRRRRSTNR